MTGGDLFPEVRPHAGVEDENQRFTTPRALAWCKHVAGVTEYDLDVAACEESHWAPTWYGWQTHQGKRVLIDGLGFWRWWGHVWCNPPWDDIRPWVERAWSCWRRVDDGGVPVESVSMLLPGNRTHRPWWQELVEPYRDGRAHPADSEATLTTYCPPERCAYGAPGNPRAIGVGEPNFTSVLLVWRPR